jgi:hypothetical protein
MADIAVTDAPECSRYEAHDGSELLGVLEYHRKAGLIVFDHTEVEPPARGRGIAAALVAQALADAREDGLGVVPTCPYVRRWIERNTEFLPLVASKPRPAP